MAQVSIGVKHFELLSPRLGCRYRFTVQKEPPSVSIQAGNLVAGIEQEVIINILTGSHVINKVYTFTSFAVCDLTIINHYFLIGHGATREVFSGHEIKTEFRFTI